MKVIFILPIDISEQLFDKWQSTEKETINIGLNKLSKVLKTKVYCSLKLFLIVLQYNNKVKESGNSKEGTGCKDNKFINTHIKNAAKTLTDNRSKNPNLNDKTQYKQYRPCSSTRNMNNQYITNDIKKNSSFQTTKNTIKQNESSNNIKSKCSFSKNDTANKRYKVHVKSSSNEIGRAHV